MLEKSRRLACDAVIFDLEDAVPRALKEDARTQLVEFLSTPFEKPCFVRINASGTDYYQSDLETVAVLRLVGLVLPKANAESVFLTSSALDNIGAQELAILPLIESALAVETVLPLLDASPRIMGAQFGAEDLTAELGIPRTPSGDEISYARHRVVYGCRARGLPAYDTPFLDFQDDEGLISDSRVARSIGFAGKTCIHPSQIDSINRAFAPTEQELDEARQLLSAAEKTPGGAFSFKGKMIDDPVLQRARQLLDRE